MNYCVEQKGREKANMTNIQTLESFNKLFFPTHLTGHL